MILDFAPLLSAMLLASVGSAPRLADDPEDDAKLRAFLSSPHEVFEKDDVPKGFRIVALSNLAEYCGRRNHAPCLRGVLGIATSQKVSPFGRRDLRRVRLDDHGVYLAHLAVIMTEVRSRLGDATVDPVLHRIAGYLAEATEKSPDHHVASYPTDRGRYPADEAVVLYALHRYDEVYNTNVSAPLISLWLSFMKGPGASLDGLHRSEIRGVKPWSGLARGCAMSWTIRYMAAFAPKAAADLWARYAERHEVKAWWLLGGFREWPPGVDRPGDIDSGPIVMGVGVAATAFAIGASKAVGDRARHERLVRTMNAVYKAGGPEAVRLGRTILARAIALNGT